MIINPYMFGNAQTLIGSLFTPTYNSGDYTKAAGVNAVFGANSIRITTPGNPASAANTLYWTNYQTNIEDFEVFVEFTVKSVSSTSHGFSVGLIAPQTHGILWATIGMGGGNEGILFLFRAGGTTSLPKSFEVDLDDQMYLRLTRVKNVVTAYVLNVTKGTSATLPYTYNLSTATGSVIPNVSRFGFQMYGGDVEVTNWGASTTQYTNPDLLLIGDSKTVGYCATTQADSVPAMWRAANPTKLIYSNSGPSLQAFQVVTTLMQAELIKYQNPRYVIIFLGRNDLATQTVANTVTRLQTIASWFPSSTIYYQLPVTEAALSQVALTTEMQARLTNLISLPATWNTGTDLNADGIHPNNSGMLKIYNNQAATITL